MKILIVDDFITTKGFFSKYLTFLKDILLKLNLDVDIATKHNFSFSRDKLCSMLNLDISNDRFINIKTDTLTLECIEYIKSYIDSYDLLITYELCNETKKLFDMLNVKYIDIWLSPIRFQKDMMFSFYSNDIRIQNQLKSFKIKKKKNFKQAFKIKSYFQNFVAKKIDLENNSALIIGQMLQDKSVMKEDIFLTLNDYKNEISNISKEHKKLYFLKHPYMSETDFMTILDGFKDIPNIEYLENINTYYLLSQDEITSVIGLSSSVIAEAKYFNKNIVYLYKSVLDNNYSNIYKKFYKTSFWSAILNIDDVCKTELLVHDNFLRYYYNIFWSYDIFLDNIHKNLSYKNLIKIYNFCSKLDKQKKHILYGYGSVGKLIAPHIPNLIGVIDKNILQNNCKLPIMELSDLTKYQDVLVIVSPFIHKDEIDLELKKFTGSILHIKGL